jgi:hypothetical protein
LIPMGRERPGSSAVGSVEQLVDPRGGEFRLGEEADGRTGLDQLEEVALVVGRDENHPRGAAVDAVGETPGEIETALGAEVDVDESDLRPQLLNSPDCLSARGRESDDGDSLTFEQVARSFREARLVVDDEAAQGHAPRIAAETLESMGASLEIARIRAIAAVDFFPERVTVSPLCASPDAEIRAGRCNDCALAATTAMSSSAILRGDQI